MDGGLAMWSESLKIRLGMTAGWLAMAACLLLAARLGGPVSASVSSMASPGPDQAAADVRMVSHSKAPTLDDAG
jgi:hypothetical protein